MGASTKQASGGSITAGTTVVSGATTGSVFFAGASSVIQQDNANFFWDDTNNRLGLGTITPSTILSLGGQANQTVGVERITTSNTAGKSLTLKAGGATVLATNKNGGTLFLSGGQPTGTGNSGVTIVGYGGGSSGTSDASGANLVQFLWGATGACWNPWGASAGQTYSLKFFELTASFSVGFKAPDALSNSWLGVLPSTDPTAGQVLTAGAPSAGISTLSWTTPGISWGATASGATGTGVALTMSNSYASGGKGISITMGDTQTNVLVANYADLGEAVKNHVGFKAIMNPSGRGYLADFTTHTDSFGSAVFIQKAVDQGNVNALFFSHGDYNSTLFSGYNSTDTDSTACALDTAVAVTANLNAKLSGEYFFNLSYSRTNTRVSGSITDAYDTAIITRTTIQNGGGGTFVSTGAVMKLANVATQTAGTLTDSSPVLSLVQSNNSTGGHIKFNTYSGVPLVDGTMYFDGTNFKCRVGGATKTFTII